MTAPIVVTKRSGRAAGSGTTGKDYHIIWIQHESGRALVITRWGKSDQWGTGWNVATFNVRETAARFFTNKSKEKFEGEYRTPLKNVSKEANDLATLRRILGRQYWEKIGKSNLSFLFPDEEDFIDMNTTADETFAIDEDGNVVVVPPKTKSPEEIEAERDAEIAAKVAVNSRWGMF
jgi:hypothetical protein